MRQIKYSDQSDIAHQLMTRPTDLRILTLFRMERGGWGGGGKKAPPTSFSSVTSTNIGISPQNFLTFSFNPFATLV